jgi:hypothetical protein
MERPTLGGYNSLLWGYAMHANNKDPTCSQQARELLMQLQDLSTRVPALQPDVVSHATMLLAYSNGGLPLEAEQYLNEMEQHAETTNVYPNTICYNTTMSAWLKSRRPESLDKVIALLHRMDNLKAMGVPCVKPDRFTYGFVIEAYAKSPMTDGPERAEALLFQTAQDEDANLRPDIVTYNKVLSAFAKRSFDESTKGAERTEHLLRRMQRQHEWSPNCFPAPDLASYNCCISAWTNIGGPEALQRASSLVNEVENAYLSGNVALKPTKVTFNSFLAAVAKSHRPDAVEKAEAILTRMEHAGVQRDIYTYNTFLNVLARQDCTTGENADRAMLILKTMEDEYRRGNETLRPNAFTYNTVIKAVGKGLGQDAPIRCERLLQRMVHLSENQGRYDLRPGVLTFTTVLDAWARSGRKDVLLRMEKVIDMMEGFAIPNVVSFNTILSAISKSGLPDAGLRAETVFRRLQASGDAVAPNNFTFSTIISCWARSRLPGAAERAEAYFRRMEELYKAGNPEFKPVTRTYTSLLHAWAQSSSPDAVERSLKILDELEEQSHANLGYFKPNSFTYNAVLNCVAKQEARDRKVKLVKEVYARQIQAYESGNEEAAPNTVTYTILLNACAYAGGTEELNLQAFEFAQEAMQEMRKRNLRPNAFTFANYLLCCKYLLQNDSEKREEMAKAAFKESCDLGLLTQKIVEVFRSTVSEQVYTENMVNTVNFLDSSFNPLSR